MLENSIGRLLRHMAWPYQAAKVGDDHFAIRFPFVRFDQAHRAQAVIKPLYLAQEDTTRIINKGDTWVGRIRRLKRYGQLPSNVLFALSAPPQEAKKRYSAYTEIRDDLTDCGVAVVAANDDQAIARFAEQAS